MRSTAPYGSWSSPLRADRIAAGAKRLAAPRLRRDALLWLESRPEQGGRVALMELRAGALRELSPPAANLRTRVHEYGGGEYGFAGEVLVYADLARPGIQCLGGEPVPGTLAGARYADFAGSRDGRWLLAVEEEHFGSEPDAAVREPANRLVAFDLASGRRLVVLGGCDFVSSPRFTPDGRRVACLAWDHPSLPFLGTRLVVLAWGPDGPRGTPRVVAGGPGESLFQPEFAPDGRLGVVSDRSGWWNLYLERGGELAPVCPRAAEFGFPQWALGMSSWAFASAREIVCTFGESGAWRLARLDLGSGRLAPFALPYAELEGVCCDGARAAFVAAGPTTPPVVCTLDLASGRVEEHARAFGDDLDPATLSRAESVTFPSADGREAHAFLYRPQSARFEGPHGERPPLVVKSHGGPTAAAGPALRLAHQFWTSRGFALVDVNYGGSTGFGRAYRERLRGRWGELDVEDCAFAARFLAAEGLADPARRIATGGSAGGFTTLCLLTFRDEFAAGASHYGIGDLEGLARDTHKFESRYTDWLVGPWPETRALYRARSPLHHSARLARPVIFFQGLEDRVVPPEQAEAMAAALAARGIPHALVTFPDEGHGFRRAENVQRALEAELWFYGRVLGFAVDGAPSPEVLLR
jgi:dipeptidyl aminopeptidase/acylaminoacyl peptidase